MREILPFLIPITALMIPIVAILVSHQQKMAQLIYSGQRSAQNDSEIAALREEVRALREAVTYQSLAIDSQRSTTSPSNIEDRFRTNA